MIIKKYWTAIGLTAATLGLGLFAMGCSNPADNVTEAEVSEVEESESSEAESAESETSGEGVWFAFDGDSSTIGFTGSKVTGSHVGGFEKFTGKILIADGKPVSSSENHVEIDMDSTWSDNDRLTGHLKNADFFNVPEFPTSKFELTQIVEKSGPKGESHEVSGKLTLHGVTKAITFPAAIEAGEDQATMKAEFFINRFDFNIKYPGKQDDLIREEVVIRLDVVAKPESA